jgi:hypothetical protein
MSDQPISSPKPPEPIDPDMPNPFGPDSPNVRDDEPPLSDPIPLADPPKPPKTALDDDDFAPDET